MRHLLAFAVTTLASVPALAAPIAIFSDGTDDIAYSSNTGKQTAYFGNSSRGDFIGDGFNTAGVAVSASAALQGGTTVDLTLNTQFNGLETLGGYTTRYADVFLRTPASGASQGAFNYALVLGDQGSNGGISQAGLYANPTYKTSADIWTGRSNMTFGGAFVQSGADVATAAPIATVATGGNLLDAATVTQASDGRGGYTVDVTFTLTDSQAGAFANGFDLLWGTGDCGNDAIFGTTGGGSPTPVPEPGTLAILGAGVLAALSLRCRARLVA